MRMAAMRRAVDGERAAVAAHHPLRMREDAIEILLAHREADHADVATIALKQRRRPCRTGPRSGSTHTSPSRAPSADSIARRSTTFAIITLSQPPMRSTLASVSCLMRGAVDGSSSRARNAAVLPSRLQTGKRFVSPV